jgi:tape measure domain-containing protein
MAEGNVQLKLQASLDLAFLRAQVASLGKSLKTGGVSVVATLDTKQLQKDVAKLGKEIRIKINDKALDATVDRIKTVEARLKNLQSVENKVVVGVTAKSAVTQKDARKVRSDVYRSIMQSGGKIMLPVGLQPISQTAVNAFKADLQKKLGSVNIKVNAAVGAMPTAGQAGASRRPSYLDAPAFKTELEKLSRATFAQLQKGASGLRGGRTRTELERLLSQFAQTNPQGAQRTRDLNALREMLARGRYQQGVGIEARMANGGGQSGQFQRTLDTFARGLFRMLGMDPARLRAEQQARRILPAINWQAQTPQRNIPIGPSSTGRALPGAPDPALLPGTRLGGQAVLPVGRRGGALAVQAELADFYRTVEVQVRNTFDIIADYHARSLRSFQQSYQQAIATYHRNLLTAAAGQGLRPAQVVDLGPSVRPALAGGAAPPMLPPAGGSGGSRGGGFDRVTGSGEPPRPRGGALAFPQTQLPENYLRTVRQSLQLRDAIRGADQYLRQARVPLAGAIEELGGEFAQATKQVLLYGTAYKALAFFMDLPNQTLRAATALQTFRNQLNAITGSAENANRSFNFVDNLADRFSVPLESARTGFVRLYASMAPAGFDASQIENLFTGISKAAATLGLSRDQVDRVTYAFSQMASKGQLMAEEVTGQLGDVIPGALSLMAEAAQMDIPTFKKAMEDGMFTGKAFAAVMANIPIVLEKRFGEGAKGAAKTLRGSLNDMQNSLQLLYEAFEPLVGMAAQNVFPLISGAIKDATDATKAFSAAAQGSSDVAAGLSGNALAIFQVMNQVADIGRVVGSIFSQLAPTFAALGQAILTTVQFIANLVNTPIGLFLTSAAIKTAAFTAALQLLARAGLLAATSGVVRFARMLTVGLVPALSAATGAVRIFRLALTGIVAGGIILALEAVAGAVMGIGNNAKKSSADLANMRNELDRLAGAGMVAEVSEEYANANTKLIVAQRKYSKALADLQKERERVSIGAMGDVPRDIPAMERAAQDAFDEVVATRKALADARKSRDTAMRVWTEGQQQTGALAPIPPGAGDGAAGDEAEKARQAALDKAQRDAERLKNQQQQLITATADHQSKLRDIAFAKDQDLAEQRYEELKGFIDAEYDYRLTRANEVQAVQLNLEKKLSEARLSSLRAVEMSELRLREARLRVENAQARRTAAAQVVAMENQATAVLPAGAPSAPALPPSSGRPVPPQVIEYLTGDPAMRGTRYYDPAGHGGAVHHEHLAFQTKKQRNMAMQGLRARGLTIGSVDRPGDPGYHGSGQAIDVPAYPNFQRLGLPDNAEGERRLGAMVRGALWEIFGGAGANAPMSGPAFSMQRREQNTEFGVEEAQAEEKALKEIELRRLQNDLLKDVRATAIEVADAIGQVLPLEQLRLENQLLEQRNALLLQGAPDEIIEATERLTIAKAKSASIEAGLNSQIEKANKDQKALKKLLDEGKISQDGYNLAIANSNNQIKEYKDGLAELPSRLQAVTSETLKSALAQLQNADALTRVRETIETIERAVGDAMGSYKNFLVNVARGEGLTKSLKEFQNALRDQALTLFFDFAMKPMQKFMENSLKGIFDVPIEEQIRQEQMQKLQEQISLLTQIRDNIQVLKDSPFVTGPQPAQVAPSDATMPASPATPSGVIKLPVEPYGVQNQPPLTIPHSQRIYDPRVMSSPVTELFAGQGGSDDQMPDLAGAADIIKQDASVYSQAILAPAKGIGAAANFAKSANQTWQQSLGAAVQSIGMAAGAVMSIAGGVSQIKQGGASNVLGGIGSIFMGIGGALGGFGNLGSLFGGGAGAAGGFAASGPLASVGTVGGLSSGFTMPRFANGGIVNGPTLGLVGEGKYNEAIVPLPDGRSIPVKVAGGPSPREAMANGGMASAGPSVMSFSFETTKINGVEYVSRDQLELAMAATRKEAVKEGAKRGMDMTMDKIRNSPAARQSIAMGRR